MATESKAGGLDVLMGLTATVGGMLGLLPLDQKIFGAEQGGLYRYVTGQLLHLNLQGIWTYLTPVIFMVFFFGIVIGLDIYKKSRN